MKVIKYGRRLVHRHFKVLNRNCRGFTLVELLIVVAILGVLAAVVLPNVTGLTDDSKTKASEAEMVTVQTAMDTMMAKLGLSSVNATSATKNMATFPTGSPLYPNFLRTATTKNIYSCSTTGAITKETDGY